MRFLSLQLTFVAFIAMSTQQASASEKRKTLEFQIAPYIWLAGQSGTVATLPGLPPADIDIEFYDDVLDNLNGALMLVSEVKKGPLGIVFDIAYTDIESDTATLGEFFSTLTSQTTSWVVSGACFYRLFENDTAFADGMIGARYWSVDSELTLSGSSLGEISIDNSKSWVDPLVGFKGMSMIEESNFFLSGFLVIGGFGAASDFMWDANLNLGYQWSQRFSTTIGYRYLSVDYESGDFLYDVSQDGLLLGLSWRF